MKILVVDDSKAIFTIVSEMLSLKSHESKWAEDGAVACEMIGKEDFDVILLDWNMPNMTGPEFLEKNKLENLTSSPVIMMTTENKPDKIKKALELGAREYIMKPFTEDILLNKIDLVVDSE